MIEAYGVKGMKNTTWRKTFKNVAALNRWVEKNDADVNGSSRDDELDVTSESVPCNCGGRITLTNGECDRCDDPQVWGA